MTATLEQMIADWLESVEPASTLQRVWKLRGQPNDWTLENVPNAVVDEFNRLGALHSGGLPVQAPVFVDETEEHFGRPGLVIGYIDGEPDLNPDDPNKYVSSSLTCWRRFTTSTQRHQVWPWPKDRCVNSRAS